MAPLTITLVWWTDLRGCAAATVVRLNEILGEAVSLFNPMLLLDVFALCQFGVWRVRAAPGVPLCGQYSREMHTIYLSGGNEKKEAQCEVRSGRFTSQLNPNYPSLLQQQISVNFNKARSCGKGAKSLGWVWNVANPVGDGTYTFKCKSSSCCERWCVLML